jgi:nitroimidazol reductase NimA-like FMN-containing flavoprotein (pyridoxamine 5'-phosphate oxidase superfamily)
MSSPLQELSPAECRELLEAGGVGRVAFRSPSGQQIVPVNFQVNGNSIVFRTTPYTELGLHGPGTNAAFEVDHLDAEHQAGWSVVARGRLQVVSDHDEVKTIQRDADPEPWAWGVRRLYLKLPMANLTGRRLEPG